MASVSRSRNSLLVHGEAKFPGLMVRPEHRRDVMARDALVHGNPRQGSGFQERETSLDQFPSVGRLDGRLAF